MNTVEEDVLKQRVAHQKLEHLKIMRRTPLRLPQQFEEHHSKTSNSQEWEASSIPHEKINILVMDLKKATICQRTFKFEQVTFPNLKITIEG